MLRLQRIVFIGFLACALMGMAASAYAQATPYDAMADGLITLVTHHIGPLLVILVIIGIGVAAGVAMHSPAAGIVAVFIGFFIVFVMASAINGNALAWLGVTSAVQ